MGIREGRGKRAEQHAEEVRKSDQLNRAKGVKGKISPCGVKGRSPLWGLGQRPNCFAGDQFQENRQQRRRQRSVPASNFARPQTRPPSRSTNLPHIVATYGRDRVAGLSDIAALFRNAGISLLRERGGGFALAPSTPSQCTLLLLDFYWSRENRRCGGDKGAFRSPPLTPSGAHYHA